MVDYHAATPRIHCTGSCYIVKIGGEEMGRWNDIRQAKAARWAARSAMDLNVSSATVLDLIDYAVSSPDLWMTFDTELDQDCHAEA